MKSNIIKLFGFLMLSVAFVFPATENSENTAKTSFAQAVKTARSWKNDAEPVQISGPSVNENGVAEEWIYSFYSSQAKSWYNVSIRGDKVEGTEVGFGRKDLLSEPFIDSNKAMEIAKANGLKGALPSMALSVYQFGGKPAGYWLVTGGYETGDVSIFLEAKSGKFYRRNVIE